MNPTRFDRISKLFAARRTRRQALVTGGAGIAAAGLANAGLGHATAQDATPAATPESGFTGEKVMYLFVQSFQSGSIAPTADTDGRYTVTLEDGLGQTIYFGDRPSRNVGAVPTSQFLAGLGFPDDNPPNAALLVETESGETDIAVVELFNPMYDPTTRGVTYDVAVLENWEDDLELGLSDEPADLATLAPAFGAAHLLIDDCAAGNVACYASENSGYGERIATFTDVAMCFDWDENAPCIPCEPYHGVEPIDCSTYQHWSGKCTDTYPDQCGAEGCLAWFTGADILGCGGGTTPSDV